MTFDMKHIVTHFTATQGFKQMLVSRLIRASNKKLRMFKHYSKCFDK